MSEVRLHRPQSGSGVERPRLGNPRAFPGLLSGRWIPRSLIQAIGAVLLGAGFLFGGSAFLFSISTVNSQFNGQLESGLFTLFLSGITTVVITCIGCLSLFVGFRFTFSAIRFRRYQNQRRKPE